ncbi:unnamed protein product [Parajaminaea phylloscopi]
MWAQILVLAQLLWLPLTLLSLTPSALLLSVLSLGPLPKHVAFIMDGNRRWARSLTPAEAKRQQAQGGKEGAPNGVTSQPTAGISGHQSGFEALKRVLDLCLQLGTIEHVTVYAFAIDNFKRKADEVDELMALTRRSLLELAGHGEVLARHKARLKVVGRKEMLPADVQEAVKRVEDMTRENKGPTLNICIPYSSRDEMAGAIRARTLACLARREARENGITPSAYNDGGGGGGGEDDSHAQDEVALLEREMMLAHSPPVDIMVRTSGVQRLSDFMLWQITAETLIRFVPTYWPVFGLWDLLPILLQWQTLQFRRWLIKKTQYEG